MITRRRAPGDFPLAWPRLPRYSPLPFPLPLVFSSVPAARPAAEASVCSDEGTIAVSNCARCSTSDGFPEQAPPLHAVPAVLAGLVLLWAMPGCSSFLASARNAQGVRLFQQARYDEALRQFQEANYTDPDNADACYNLAATYHRLGKLEGRQDYLDQAENYYNQSLDRDDNHCESYRGLAVLLAEQGRRDEAFRLLEGWVDRHPQESEARVELARLCQEAGDVEAAKGHLVDALALEPANDRALAALGKIREESGELDQALAVYQRSLWHNQFRPEVAARVAALRSTLGSGGGLGIQRLDTRLVDRPATPLR